MKKIKDRIQLDVLIKKGLLMAVAGMLAASIPFPFAQEVYGSQGAPGNVLRKAIKVPTEAQVMSGRMLQPQIVPTGVTPSDAPGISAKTAIVIERNSGKILYEKNAEEKVFPASTTKIMTALLAIENGDMDKKVKIAANAAGVEGSSIYLAAGEEIPLRDLVYGLMLRSGNDAAIAIAEEIGGTKENFVNMMNQKAQEIGAVNTHFMNPNGLHDEQHYTTSYDMALIGREAMKNPEFRTVAATKKWVTDRGEGKYNYFFNKNKVIYQYSGGTGIKIGYTKVAGRTLVASSERDGLELICVVMNAPDWFQDTYSLMDYIHSSYKPTTIAQAQQPLKSARISGGDKDFALVGTKESIVCPVKNGEQSNLSIEYVLPEKIKAPVSRWEKAGEIKIFSDGAYLFSQPLYYLEDVSNK